MDVQLPPALAAYEAAMLAHMAECWCEGDVWRHEDWRDAVGSPAAVFDVPNVLLDIKALVIRWPRVKL